jgi:hypothetical protein
LVLALVDVFAAARSADKARRTDAVAALAHLARPTVLLLVAARLAGGVQADLSL